MIGASRAAHADGDATDPGTAGDADAGAADARPAWLERGLPAHWLGTDHLGRDVLSRMLNGARISVVVGLCVAVLAGAFGTFIGLVAGFVGGRTDTVLVQLVDMNIALPGLLLALLILAVVKPGLIPVILVLSVDGWMVFACTVRRLLLTQHALPHMESAIITCRRRRTVIAELIPPTLAAPLLTLAVLKYARVVLAEAALSFLGLGV